MSFDLSGLGVWTELAECKVQAERAIAYAAATNDTNSIYASGDIAPPLFAIVPMFETPVLTEVVSRVVPAEHALKVLHGEHDITFHRPIRAGSVLRFRGAPVGVHVKPSGTTLVIKLETTDEEGLVNTQYATSFYRGVTGGVSAGEEAPGHKLPRVGDPVAQVVQHLDDDQTYRYAPASGDMMPIHLEDDVARSVGLPGIIVHGLCTMAFVSQAVTQELGGDDPRRLRRLAVRFSKPVLPGSDITTRFWAAGKGTYAFETLDPHGEVVIKDGLAEVSS